MLKLEHQFDLPKILQGSQGIDVPKSFSTDKMSSLNSQEEFFIRPGGSFIWLIFLDSVKETNVEVLNDIKAEQDDSMAALERAVMNESRDSSD